MIDLIKYPVITE